ncbi:hypothetical protein GCM10027062_46020 [Nocardioides hungaricus]
MARGSEEVEVPRENGIWLVQHFMPPADGGTDSGGLSELGLGFSGHPREGFDVVHHLVAVAVDGEEVRIVSYDRSGRSKEQPEWLGTDPVDTTEELQDHQASRLKRALVPDVRLRRRPVIQTMPVWPVLPLATDANRIALDNGELEQLAVSRESVDTIA